MNERTADDKGRLGACVRACGGVILHYALRKYASLHTGVRTPNLLALNNLLYSRTPAPVFVYFNKFHALASRFFFLMGRSLTLQHFLMLTVRVRVCLWPPHTELKLRSRIAAKLSRFSYAVLLQHSHAHCGDNSGK